MELSREFDGLHSPAQHSLTFGKMIVDPNSNSQDCRRPRRYGVATVVRYHGGPAGTGTLHY